MRFLVAATVLLASVLSVAEPVAAAGADRCPLGQTPAFVAGFAALSAQLGPIMGTPSTCEYPDPAGTGDVQQNTTTGLAFWRSATNTPTFTDGYNHWALTANGPVHWQGASVEPPSSAAGFIYAVVEPPNNPPGELSCLKANPSCARDAWWAEWNELQDAGWVQYRFLGPGFVTEARFVEAVWLLWRWPEGQALLQGAANKRVRVVSASSIALSTAFAAYAPSRGLIGVNDDFTETSTWMVADLLAHELRHAADRPPATTDSETFQECIATEQTAYQTEARYLHWVSETFGGLPSASQVADELSYEDYDLYRNLIEIATAADVDALALNDYRESCAE
jgi:hypothetical protein